MMHNFEKTATFKDFTVDFSVVSKANKLVQIGFIMNIHLELFH